ncbi:MAG: peptide deformylase [Azospirillaceae bacterium]|nr:peptide deformylase [Azospirillaceae bacterium]
MALLKIARMGHPVLRQRAAPVVGPVDQDLRRLIDDMIETMLDAPGVGLAAPQIHVARRVIVFRVPVERAGPDSGDVPAGITALINPEFEPLADQQVFGWEGCLSIPGLRGDVPRWQHIRYRGLTPEGEAVDREALGFHARVVQHETDHLDGILFLDRMPDLTRLAYAEEMRHFAST